VSYADDTLDLPDGDTAVGRVLPFTVGAGSGVGRLEKAAKVRDDISGELTEQDLAKIGADVVRDWRMDLAGNQKWRQKAEDALDAAAQEDPEDAKTYPFQSGSSDVRYPLLTISGLAFASRAAPAIIKGDEAVKVKTFGKDPKGNKQARALRLAEYLNWKLFYGIDDWEKDMDAMLHRLPAVGQHYSKVYWDAAAGKPCVERISALRLTIPVDAPSLRRSPRITHDFDRYPFELQKSMARGEYRRVDIAPSGEDEQQARIILEQHRMMDLDKDDIDEPYVVTVDAETEQVLRIEEAFDDEDIKSDPAGPSEDRYRW
jgi:chaperonin GroES